MNPFQVVRDFEEALAEYAGSKYAVTTDSCTSAIRLCLELRKGACQVVKLPCMTYPSIPCQVVHAGLKIQWDPTPWSGVYMISPLQIIDGAKRFRRGMYENTGRTGLTLHCLSFHSKKHLPIGRGGAILTDCEYSYDWLRRMRFDGRHECPLSKQQVFDMVGFNCYMTPEQAARGLLLLSMAKDWYEDQIEDPPYPDLSQQPAFLPYTEPMKVRTM